MTEYFVQAFIYLVSAVIIVPLAKRLGLGSVLGYLIAGVVIGPITGLVGDETTTIQHFAEFGVVMMLFVVGLEIEPKALWQMKARLLGLGGAQLVLTTGLIMAIAISFGLAWQTALAVGLILALSSTAIVLQTFNEKHLSHTEGGRGAFKVLLFQDIAVIPMLALLPLLALAQFAPETAADAHHGMSLVDGLPGWAYMLVIVLSIGGLIAAGHFLSQHLFRYVANSGLREIFVATALLLVIGIAALMSLVGLSPALGTFLAGVVLANSDFRHELESNIEPFKGLLLGLFFITVGAGVDFGILLESGLLILGLALGLMLLKFLVLFVLAKAMKVKGSDGWLMALSLAQAGEFGFVLVSFSNANGVLPPDLSPILLMVIALSMFLTPALFIAFDKWVLPRYQKSSNDRQPDEITQQGMVLIAGAGRFGQIVNRLLVANGIPTVVLDRQAAQVDNLKAVNIKSYFGDASRPDLLHTAGIEKAKLVVIAFDDREEAVELTHYLKQTYPKLKVLVRAFDRGHHYQLRKAGADWVESETYHSAMELGIRSMKKLGMHGFEVEQKAKTFKQVEQQASEKMYQQWCMGSEGEQYDHGYVQMFIELDQQISLEMGRDRQDTHSSEERGWTPPPKGYAEKLQDEGA
ncbi:monovalent cation:proton antiporter-2 (CPA2) family protein [Ferrimonas aestuarii]|uniref:Potassium transporter n=1 Tax=Ferrimonas aestuarii TaxID=2569539 RepID=A0A4U1BUZ0_9GAMM|nr:monovalent cation:proton antiporter-2 (CPA2) family protein [Ferrimonas aestuarii]TKB56641.1 potassium transporter [Ferrimonas aestuarii]